MRGVVGTKISRALVVGLLLAWIEPAWAQSLHREGFEGRDLIWIKGPADAPYRETAHELTDAHAHSGQRSETIRLDTEVGTAVNYWYATPRAPLSEDLRISLWLRANRPGVQVMARLVFPNERDPQNPGEPLTTLLRGDVYQLTSRWQSLEVRRLAKVVAEQQQLLRAELKRDLNFEGAYVDRVLLNLYAGPGVIDVWIDDLEIGPVADDQQPIPAAPQRGGPVQGIPAVRANPRRPALVDIDRDQLKVNGKRFFFRVIRHTDTPLKVLRDAGFNAVCFDSQASPAAVEEAVRLGFWLVPSLPLAAGEGGEGGAPGVLTGRGTEGQLVSREVIGRTVSRFLEQDAVLFWNLGGGGLVQEQAAATARTASLVHAQDPQRPLGADIWDGFSPHARTVNLLGVHRWPLMTSLELVQYRDWLQQRRNLATPGAFLWTWVQTHLPEWHIESAGVGTRNTERVALRAPAAEARAFEEPVGPLPQQVRLLAYTAIGSGCRGLGFWSDRFLADSHQGRDRLLGLALLNMELQMLEPLLVTAQSPLWIETSLSEVKASVMRCDRAVLVLPVWMGRGGQFVPGQAGATNLSVIVPQVPSGATAWEVGPGLVRALRSERVPGGTRVMVPEFDSASAIVFTSDSSPTGLLVRLQDQARKYRKLAAQWSHDLVVVEAEKVTHVLTELEQAGHALPEDRRRLEDARRRLEACARHWSDGDYTEAQLEARRAGRALHIAMREHWEKAAGELDAPVASPYAVSFFTLARHWRFADELLRLGTTPNALPNGDFELATERQAETWLAQEASLDGVDLVAERVTDKAHQGRQCLKLEIKPKKNMPAPLALERTFLAIHSPAVRLQPGTPVRITGWIRLPTSITASADGALLYDSAGGEPLALRLTSGTGDKWRQVTMYRRVPASGTINVTVALTGLGSVYFDDIRIEPLVSGGTPLVSATGAAPAEGSYPLRSPHDDDDERQRLHRLQSTRPSPRPHRERGADGDGKQATPPKSAPKPANAANAAKPASN